MSNYVVYTSVAACLITVSKTTVAGDVITMATVT